MTSIFFTPDMLQDPNRAASLSNNFGINSLSQNYDVNTTLSNGDSIKQLIMQYQTFENNNDIDKLNNFLGSLQKRITPEEYKVFNAFNRIFYDLKSKKIEELSGED
jgi:hypothetical protein